MNKREKFAWAQPTLVRWAQSCFLPRGQGHEAIIKVGALGALRSLEMDPGLTGTAKPIAATAAPAAVAAARGGMRAGDGESTDNGIDDHGSRASLASSSLSSSSPSPPPSPPSPPPPLVARGLTVELGGRAVLRSLALTLAPGQIVGVAGSSGSGKSTLLKASLGLYPDYGGRLSLFGAEARRVDKAALADLTAYAPQEPFLLTGTVRENLLCACPGQYAAHVQRFRRCGSRSAGGGSKSGEFSDNDAGESGEGIDGFSGGFGDDGVSDAGGSVDDKCFSDETLLEALAKAGLDPPADFGEAWRRFGLDALIHEAGRNLSGGQRQRLGLARVFLQRGAQLIVLDEATSALDNVTEASVIEALHAHARQSGAAMVMVAHRLTTLRRADRVLVLEGGVVAQDGAYADLEASAGPFQDLLEASGTALARTS